MGLVSYPEGIVTFLLRLKALELGAGENLASKMREVDSRSGLHHSYVWQEAAADEL